MPRKVVSLSESFAAYITLELLFSRFRRSGGEYFPFILLFKRDAFHAGNAQTFARAIHALRIECSIHQRTARFIVILPICGHEKLRNALRIEACLEGAVGDGAFFFAMVCAHVVDEVARHSKRRAAPGTPILHSRWEAVAGHLPGPIRTDARSALVHRGRYRM